MFTYRSLDRKLDWPFFEEGESVPADCLPLIRPLTKDSSSELWCDFVSSIPRARHPMLLPDDAWPSRLVPSDVSTSWQEDWNTETATSFEDWLRASLPWAPETPVIFTWAREESIETTWGVFTRCWRAFLYDDEGPFLWSLSEPEAIAFTPGGLAYVGYRLPPRPFTRRIAGGPSGSQ